VISFGVKSSAKLGESLGVLVWSFISSRTFS
jgi:hypothetical protein